MAKRFGIRSTRAGRRVFAQKAQQSASSIRHQFMLRGGGYL